MLLFLASIKIESLFVLIFVLFMIHFSFNFFNSIVMGLRTIQLRKDPKNGAKDLVPLTEFMHTLGMIGGALLGGFLADNSKG